MRKIGSIPIAINLMPQMPIVIIERLAREIRTSPPKQNRLFTNIKVKTKLLFI